jgi:hypothetical protein
MCRTNKHRNPARDNENTVKDPCDVIMAGYQSHEPAQKNFEAFVKLIKDKQVRSEGVILVEHDEDGKARVTQTGDHTTPRPGRMLAIRRSSGASKWRVTWEGREIP